METALLKKLRNSPKLKLYLEEIQLKNEEYELSAKTDSGILKSSAILNFEIPVEAIFSQEENLKSLRSLLK